MQTERAQQLAVVLWLLASAGGAVAQSAGAPAPVAVPKRADKKPVPAPAPPPAPPPTAAPKPAPPQPPPKPPADKPKPQAHPEDDAIIEQLELFMLMEMMKDYEILHETDR